VQIRKVIERSLEVVKEVRLRYVFEIGTTHSETLLLWIRVARSDATFISVFLLGGSFGGGITL